MSEFEKDFETGKAIGERHAFCPGNEIRRKRMDKLMLEVARILYRHVEVCVDSTDEDRAFAKSVLDLMERGQ